MTKRIDKLWGPPHGPCAFCGGPDARHRIWDNVLERHQAGDSVAFLAEDYDVSEEAIREIIENYQHSGQH